MTSNDTLSRVRRGELPAILGTDTTAGQDIWGFLQKMPDNLWWAFYDPKNVDVNDIGRLSEKALRTFYQPGLRFLRATAWATSPRFWGTGIESLKEMDLDSFSYMEPILHDADKVTLDFLEPLFSNEDNTSLYDEISAASISLEQLAKDIESRGITEANQVAYNTALLNLHRLQTRARTELKALSDAVDEVLEKIDAIEVTPEKESLKRERVKALREHCLRVKKQGLDLFKHMEQTSADLHELGASNQNTAEQFSEKLSKLSQNFSINIKHTRTMAETLSDMSYTRQFRKVRTRSDGRIVDETNASAEHYRQLKLGIDLRFVPDVPQTLGIVQPQGIRHNAENYFIKTTEFGLNNAFRPDGTYIPIAERGDKYGHDMGEYIAKMYSLGKCEDALYAIQLLKMAEGKEAHQLFPGSFQDMVKHHIAHFYNLSTDDVERDPHATLFLERVRDISGNRAHSPVMWGTRDTQKKYYDRLKKYIFGRMYPASDGFIAVPLHQKIVQHPLIKMRSSFVSYITGGRIVPVSELGRPVTAGNTLEDEIGLGIKRNWFWWEKKQEKTAENPKPPGFFKRAPVWFSVPLRSAMMASVPAAVIFATGGAAAPLYFMYPVIAAGAASGAVYSFQAAKSAWALPFVNKPIKLAAKAAVLAVVVVYGTPLLIAAAPTLGGWALAAASSYPIMTGLAAAPFIALPALKIASLVNKVKNPPPPPISFGDYREKREIPDDPLGAYNAQGEFLKMNPVAPQPIVIELKASDFSDDIAPDSPEALRQLLLQNRELMEILKEVLEQNGYDVRKNHEKNGAISEATTEASPSQSTDSKKDKDTSKDADSSKPSNGNGSGVDNSDTVLRRAPPPPKKKSSGSKDPDIGLGNDGESPSPDTT